MAASSVFQRSSWNVFQDTQMVLPAASADTDDIPKSKAPAIIANSVRFIRVVLLNSFRPAGRHLNSG
jgi:hypothetical protein